MLRLRARMRRRSHAEFFLSTFVSLYLSLCLAVRSRISKTTGPDFAEFPVHVSTSHCPSPTTMQYAVCFRFVDAAAVLNSVYHRTHSATGRWRSSGLAKFVNTADSCTVVGLQ